MGTGIPDGQPTFSAGQTDKSAGKRMVTAEDTVEATKALSHSMQMPGEKLKALLPRIAKAVGVTERAAKAYHDGEYKTVDAHIYFRYLKAATDHEYEFKRQQAANAANRARIFQLIHGSSDPAFYSQRALESFRPDGMASREAGDDWQG